MSEIVEVKKLPNNVSGVYKLNYPNGKSYIGISCDIKRRMYEHNNINRLKNHPNHPCDLAIKKYGKFDFIEILEYVEDRNKLSEREKFWIDYYDTTNKNIGYNLTSGGEHLVGEESCFSVFTNEEVLDIRKRRFLGERKIEVYRNFYSNKNFSTFEKIWLGKGYSNVGQEYIIPTNSISRQEYSSRANSGSKNGKAKLNEDDVRAIRKRFDNGEKICNIAKDYPMVKSNTISRICNRDTWKNVI